MARIAFFPEAAFGPALNSVGIAQACQKLGHEPVFLCDPGFVSVFEGYGFPAHGVPMSEPMAPEESRQVLGRLHQRPHPELPQIPLRADRQLREGLLGGDRLDRGLGREVAARGPGRGAARPDLHRQRHPVPGHQAPWRALGPDHLLQRERDPRPRDPAASVRLRRARPGLLCRLQCPLQRGRGAHPPQFQRVPRRVRGGALPLGRVLRALALAEPPALPGTGEVPAQPAARSGAVPVSRGLRARGGPLRGAGLRRQRRQAARSMSASAAWVPATPTCSSG